MIRANSTLLLGREVLAAWWPKALAMLMGDRTIPALGPSPGPLRVLRATATRPPSLRRRRRRLLPPRQELPPAHWPGPSWVCPRGRRSRRLAGRPWLYPSPPPPVTVSLHRQWPACAGSLGPRLPLNPAIRILCSSASFLQSIPSQDSQPTLASTFLSSLPDVRTLSVSVPPPPPLTWNDVLHTTAHYTTHSKKIMGTLE